MCPETEICTDTFSPLTTPQMHSVLLQVKHHSVCSSSFLKRSWSSARFWHHPFFGLCLTSLPMCRGNSTHCGCWLRSSCIYSTVALWNITKNPFPEQCLLPTATNLFPEREINSTDGFFQTHWSGTTECKPQELPLWPVCQTWRYPCSWLAAKHESSARAACFELSWAFLAQQASECQSLDPADLPLRSLCYFRHQVLDPGSSGELEQSERINPFYRAKDLAAVVLGGALKPSCAISDYYSNNLFWNRL